MNTVSEQPEAGRDLAAHIAEAIERDLAAHIAEAIEKERFEIVPADLYRRALEEVIRDALKVFRPQAQAANAEAVRLLREVTTHMGYIIETLSPGDGPPEPRSQWDYDAIQLEREVEQFLAQHGGRGDE